MPDIVSYDRTAAVQYAHRWAYGRNPAYFSFDEIGGDCTNFASQCLYQGTGVMNFTPDFGWYYIDPNQKAPAWTGVQFFYNFLTRKIASPGPFAIQCELNKITPGDFIQLRFDSQQFAHTLIVVSTGSPITPENTLIAAHSIDSDWRPLSSYQTSEIRFLHLIGAWPQKI